MKISISTDGEMVAQHFGRCPSFTIVDFEGSKIVSKERIDNPGHHPGYIPQFLHERGVNCIVAGGMGRSSHERSGVAVGKAIPTFRCGGRSGGNESTTSGTARNRG